MEEMLNTNGRSNELEMQRRVGLAKDKSNESVSKEKLEEIRKKVSHHLHSFIHSFIVDIFF
jgi:tagatose-1,6-bisphosphate aldolase